MNNLVLIGFSCSGKTTVGRMLAQRLRLQFVDTDRLVEQQAGLTVPEIFGQLGEHAFRELERVAVAQVCADHFQVISTGGGAYVHEQNRAMLRRGNLVVLLRVRPETVVHRLRNSRGGRPRPLLDAPDPLQRVGELMADREEAYAQSHVSIEVDERSANTVVDIIVRQWSGWRRRRQRAAVAAAAAPAQP